MRSYIFKMATMSDLNGTYPFFFIPLQPFLLDYILKSASCFYFLPLQRYQLQSLHECFPLVGIYLGITYINLDINIRALPYIRVYKALAHESFIT